ncbi:hypothetical protein [Salaquimonas pukyongi]|uniref:ATP-binding protein n=1 Tax=Salaquimonas pukyongi TaxID=2712698 RepID=UPI00096B9716|nr:hypothetical protein [Salaquimonas pukyongi]
MNKPAENRPVVLLLGNYRPALTLARTLKKSGYKVVVGSHGCERACQHSSAVSQIWEHSPLTLNVERFASELRSFCNATPKLTAIFPVAEEYVRLFAEHKSAFKGLPPVATMARELVRKCLDKPFMMQLAEENGVPTAPFATSANADELGQAVQHTGFPVIIRPADSTRRLSGKKAVTVETPEALSKATAEFKLDTRDLLLQKKFAGKRHNIYFAADKGKVLRCLHAVIDRTDNPDGTGLAVEGHTLPAEGPLVNQTARLLAALGYTGIGCAQFLVDEQTGATSFLEINPRIAGNHALPEYAGLCLGAFMLDLALGNRLDHKPVLGRAGIRYCWLTGDLAGAKGAYLRGQIGASSALAWCLRAVVCALRSHVHMVYEKNDPKPALNTLWDMVPRIARWRRPALQNQQSTIYGDNTGAGK